MDVRENLQDKCNLEDLTCDDKIEYWHTHETGNSLREFLGMTEEEYLDLVLGKDRKRTEEGEPDVREKLAELLVEFIEVDAWDNGEFIEKNIDFQKIASNLIANGVTVQKLGGCKYCEEYADLPEHFINFKPVGRVFDTCIQTDESGRWHLEVPSGTDIGIKFCPMCGRKLPQPPKGEQL